MHPPDTDKHGKDVSLFIEEAVRELRKHERTELVLCDYYRTGRLQVYSPDSYFDGDVIELAREQGYDVEFTTTRPADQTLAGDEDGELGYAEFVPANDHGHQTFHTDPIRP